MSTPQSALNRVMAPADTRAGGASDVVSGSGPNTGSGGNPGPTIDPDEYKRRTAASRGVSTSLGEIVGLLMRSRTHRFNMLAELEWMVLPAISTRQFRVAEGTSQEAGFVAPVAAVLWASVSADVDQRLSQAIEQPIKLKPEEWSSGSIVWIVEAVGEQRAVTAMLQHLKQNELKDFTVRMRVRGSDGKPAVGRLELQQMSAAAGPP